MRISIYKDEEGELSVLVEAAVGHGKPPIVIPRVTKATLREQLLPVIDHQRGRRDDRQDTRP